MILAGLFSAFSLTKLDTDSAGYDISLIAGGVFVAALAFAAFGTWRGWLPAQAVAVICGGVMILGSFALMSEANVLARLAGVQDYGVANRRPCVCQSGHRAEVVPGLVQLRALTLATTSA